MNDVSLYQLTSAGSLANILAVISGLAYGCLFNRLTGLSSAIAVIILIPILSSLNLPHHLSIILFISVLFGSECIGGQPHREQLKILISNLLLVILIYLIYSFASSFTSSLSSSDRFAVIIFTLTAFIVFSQYNSLKAVISICIGMIIATVGVDSSTGVLRATYNEPELFNGIDFITVATGVYMITSIYSLLCSKRAASEQKQITDSGGLKLVFSSVAGGLIPNIAKRSKDSGKPLYKSSFLTVSTLPLILMALPVNGTMAVILGGMNTLNIPILSSSANISEPMKTVFISLLIILLSVYLINIFLADRIRSIKRAPVWLLVSALTVLSFAGVYSSIASSTSLFICFALGTAAYFIKTQGYPRHFILIGYIMSSPLENNLRRALAISNGEIGILYSGSVSQIFWLMTSAVLLSVFFINTRRG